MFYRKNPISTPNYSSIVPFEREIVHPESASVAACEEVAVFACRCHYQYVFGASVGGSIFEFYLKFGPLLHRFALFEFAVGYHIGRIYVEELSIVGIGANFIRSVPIGERDVDAASVGATLKVGKLR